MYRETFDLSWPTVVRDTQYEEPTRDHVRVNDQAPSARRVQQN